MSTFGKYRHYPYVPVHVHLLDITYVYGQFFIWRSLMQKIAIFPSMPTGCPVREQVDFVFGE